MNASVGLIVAKDHQSLTLTEYRAAMRKHGWNDPTLFATVEKEFAGPKGVAIADYFNPAFASNSSNCRSERPSMAIATNLPFRS